LADLVLLEIQGYDVILSMDWLAKHKATIDCKGKILTLYTPEGGRLVYKEYNSNSVIPHISATRAFKMMKKGCPAYLCTIKTVESRELDPKEIPVVQEFLGVFQEVPGLPPEH